MSEGKPEYLLLVSLSHLLTALVWVARTEVLVLYALSHYLITSAATSYDTLCGLWAYWKEDQCCSFELCSFMSVWDNRPFWVTTVITVLYLEQYVGFIYCDVAV